jgi:Icc-related predicted phosphoesterase
MKILVTSDLHLEFQKDYGREFLKSLNPAADVLIIAGDLSPENFYREGLNQGVNPLAYLCKKYKEVIFVAGNHDYWWSNPKSAFDFWKSWSFIPNYNFLENGIKVIGKQRFLGASLWFKSPPILEHKKLMTDFEAIKDFEPWVYEQGKRTIKFLKKNLTKNDIVITHHLPTQKSVHRLYKNHPLNVFFINDIENLILERNPKLWVHGHTHFSFDYYIGETRILCNPFGYVEHENDKFTDNLVITV